MAAAGWTLGFDCRPRAVRSRGAENKMASARRAGSKEINLSLDLGYQVGKR